MMSIFYNYFKKEEESVDSIIDDFVEIQNNQYHGPTVTSTSYLMSVSNFFSKTNLDGEVDLTYLIMMAKELEINKLYSEFQCEPEIEDNSIFSEILDTVGETDPFVQYLESI